jgi:polyisoprenoid-binding protein YceI
MWGTTIAILGMGLILSATGMPTDLQVAQTAVREIFLSVDPARSHVRWSVDSTLHTVHGTFALKSGSVHFDQDSGIAGGEIVVFATSGQSGNSSRDEKMHLEVLESAKYPDVIFRPNLVRGKFSSSGASDVTVQGSFVLHGDSHDMTVPIHVESNGGNWRGSGKFEVPYIKWGLKNPSNFMLKVQPVVAVEVDLGGSFQFH